jgi:hypothetical protein
MPSDIDVLCSLVELWVPRHGNHTIVVASDLRQVLLGVT